MSANKHRLQAGIRPELLAALQELFPGYSQTRIVEKLILFYLDSSTEMTAGELEAMELGLGELRERGGDFRPDAQRNMERRIATLRERLAMYDRLAGECFPDRTIVGECFPDRTIVGEE